MQNSVEELTQKIYKEGIEKAEQKGIEIIKEAKQKSLDIVKNAETKAGDIIELAKKHASELKRRQEAEMRLSSRQAVSTLKQRITDLIIWDVTSEPIVKAFEDKEFVQRLIEKLVDFWLTNFAKEDSLNVLLPKKDFEAYRDFMANRGQEILKKGVNINFKGTMENGFQIMPEDNRFKVSFTDKDFENYFKTFARPRTFKLLFGVEK